MYLFWTHKEYIFTFKYLFIYQGGARSRRASKEPKEGFTINPSQS